MDEAVQEAKTEAERNELLSWASARGLLADATELLHLGANPAAKDKRGRQCVHYAASHGHLCILEFFATKGVDLDADDPTGRAPLHYASAGGHSEVVALLVEKGCWLDASDGADDTPLHLAARGGHVACAQALLTAGAKAGLVNKRSLTPLAEAVLAGRMGVAELLLKHDGSSGKAGGGGKAEGVAAQRFRGFTLLQLAAGLGQTRSVAWLLERGADVQDQGNAQRMSALHAAAASGHTATVELLLSRGADASSRSGQGLVPAQLVPPAPPPPVPRRPHGAGLAAMGISGMPSSTDYSDSVEEAKASRLQGLYCVDAPNGVTPDGLKKTMAALTKAYPQGAGLVAAAAAAAATGGGGGAGVGKKQGKGGAQGGAAGEPTPLQRFAALTYQEQARKVEGYAQLPESELAPLTHLAPPAVRQALGQVRHMQHMVNIFKAVAALRADDEFQSDVRDPAIQVAIDYVRKTNDTDRFQNDGRVLSVMAKMKRLHTVSMANGGHKVTIDDLLASTRGNDAEGTAASLQQRYDALAECVQEAVGVILGRPAGRGLEDDGTLKSADADADADVGEGGDAAGRKAGQGAGPKAAATRASGAAKAKAGAAKGAKTVAASCEIEELPSEEEAEAGAGAGGLRSRAAAAGAAGAAAAGAAGAAAGGNGSGSGGVASKKERLARLKEAATASWVNDAPIGSSRGANKGGKAHGGGVGAGAGDDGGGDDPLGLDELGEGARMSARMEADLALERALASAWLPRAWITKLGPELSLHLSQIIQTIVYSCLALSVLWWYGMLPHQVTERRPAAWHQAMDALDEARKASVTAAKGQAGLEALEDP